MRTNKEELLKFRALNKMHYLVSPDLAGRLFFINK